jgi:peptidoglycan/LPS O-acetylase OafA/YrhL
VRVGEWELMRWSAGGIGHRFETVADAIAAGCLLAGARSWLHNCRPYTIALASPLFALVPLAVVSANLMHNHPVAYFGAGLTVMNLGAALCLDWCVTYPAGRIGRVLNWRPVVYVGLMSYSLYLWQQLFLNRESSAAIATFPLNIILAAGTALASYLIVERPSLRFRRCVERWMSSPVAERPAAARLST